MTEFSACETPDILRVIYFIKILIDIVKTIVPIILIIMVSIDCAKGVISDTKKIDEALKLNKNRLISAVLIFAVPSIINLILEIIDEETTYESCWVNAESATIEKYQVLWDAEEERKRQEEEAKRQEQLLQNENLISSPYITFSYEYISDGQTFPYALYTPSTAKTNKKTPLIIWLHGLAEVYGKEATLKDSGMLKIINEWELDGFNAYVLCPHLTGYYVTEKSWIPYKDMFYRLVDRIIEEKNINKDKISIIGHSLGGTGVIFMSYDRTEYYSSVVIMSPYGSPFYGRLGSLSELPLRGYTEDSGEASRFSLDLFRSVFGEDRLTILSKAQHGAVPKIALTEDANNDNKSDLIEWMLSQSKSK